MLQIISNSNETSTGPELVQNGNFSQLGSDKINNGGFDDLGTDVITNGSFANTTAGNIVLNPNFTDTVSRIENGDFLDYTSGGSFGIDIADWKQNAVSGAVTYTKTTEGIKFIIDTAPVFTYDVRLYSGVGSVPLAMTDGKSYRVRYSVKGYNSSGSFFAHMSWLNGTNALIAKPAGINATTWTQQDVYIVASNTSGANPSDGQYLLFWSGDGAVGDWMEVKDVHVEELGENWTSVDGDIDTYNENGLTITSITGLLNRVYQANITQAEKPYKVTYTIEATSFSAGTRVRYYNNGWINLPEQGVGTHTFYYTRLGTVDSWYFDLETSTSGSTTDTVTISNITVELLGEDWTQGIGWTIGDSKAISTQALGGELITNGDFSATGGELLLNGDFKELGEDWVAEQSSGTVTFENDQVQIVSDGTALQTGITQDILTDDKNYKVTIDVDSISGTLKLQMGGDGSVTLITDTGIQTFYLSTATITNDTFYLLRNIGDTLDVVLNSVSVELLGEGWSVSNVDRASGYYVDFIATGAHFVVPAYSPITTLSTSSLTLLSGTTYKVVVDMTQVSGGLKWDIGGLDETFDETTLGTNNTRYVTPTSNIAFSLYRDVAPIDITLHSVSIQEIATSYLTQAGVLTADKTWKVIYAAVVSAGTVSATEWGAVTSATATVTDFVQVGTTTDFRMVNIDGYFEGSVTGISAELVDPLGYWTLGAGWEYGVDKAIFTGADNALISQTITIPANKWCKISLTVLANDGELYNWIYFDDSLVNVDHLPASITPYVFYGFSSTTATTEFSILGTSSEELEVTDISIEELDPNNYWVLSDSSLSIGDDKGIYNTIASYSFKNTSFSTINAESYLVSFKIPDLTAGYLFWSTGDNEPTISPLYGSASDEENFTFVANGSTGVMCLSKPGGETDASMTNLSVKAVGSYSDQSIYVTAADVQTIAQASVQYLVGLTSMTSKNSLYFIPSSVVANNGRYTKLNFTVVSKDAAQDPVNGIFSFYDSVGGLDTFPMGFYEFKIYEQYSGQDNLDPSYTVGLLEKGFAFVRDFSGNMQELPDGFKEYNPTLTQYVYSK